MNERSEIKSSSSRTKRRHRHSRSHSGDRGSAKSMIPLGTVAFFASQCVCLLMVVVVPWFYGGNSWWFQSQLNWITVCLPGLLAIALGAMALARGSIPRVPWTSWCFLGLAAYAWLQSVAIFPAEKEPNWAPPSVSIQRWALGIGAAPPSLESETIQLAGFQPDVTPCDLKKLNEPLNLAWSIEPLHTRGAIASLLLCALMCWTGGFLFSSKYGQLTLFLTLSIVGIAMSCFGIHGAFSYQTENVLGLRTGSSFGSFVSKNSAGGFLNICLAGAIGLFAWTLTHLKRKKSDVRYRFSDASFLMKIRGTVEDFLADLNTSQIASLVGLIAIFIALVISQCRGAALAAGVALLGSSLLANFKNKQGNSWIVALVLLIAAISCLIGFQIDESSYDRLESLAEYDLEAIAIDGRTYIWSIAWKALQFYGVLGSGLGTFHFAYLPFQDPSSPGWFYHAESLYAQCAVELGWLGLLLLLASVVLSAAGIRKRVSSDAMKFAFPAKFAGAFLILSQAVHSAVDFALILPALFIPACLLHGAVTESIRNSLSVAQKAKDQRELVTEKAEHGPENSWIRVFVCVLLLVAVSAGGLATMPWLRNLAAGEGMELWVRKEDKQILELQRPDRVKELLRQWSLDAADLKKNPTAMRTLAEATVFDFRMKQLLKRPASVSWSEVWPETTPLLMQLALDRVQTDEGQAQIVSVFGGAEGVDTLEQASTFYARAHALSPLDWKSCWGRSLTALRCSRSEMSRLLSPTEALARHVPTTLLNSAFLFRKQLDNAQVDRMWKQSMRTNPASSVMAARSIAAERDTSTFDISIFPQRSEVLQEVANQVFTKEKYPTIHKEIWVRAREIIGKSSMSVASRETWLADACQALDDLNGEIEHLRVAFKFEPSNVRLACRLANRLLDIQDAAGANTILQQVLRFSQEEPEIKSLRERISRFGR